MTSQAGNLDRGPRGTSVAAATILSLIIPGSGQMYLGYNGRGVLILVGVLFFGVISPVMALIAWFLAVVHAWSVARERSDDEARDMRQKVGDQSVGSRNELPIDPPPLHGVREGVMPSPPGLLSADALIVRLKLASRLHCKGILDSDEFLRQRIRAVTDLALTGPVDKPEVYLEKLEEHCENGTIERTDLQRVKAVLYP